MVLEWLLLRIDIKRQAQMFQYITLYNEQCKACVLIGVAESEIRVLISSIKIIKKKNVGKWNIYNILLNIIHDTKQQALLHMDLFFVG